MKMKMKSTTDRWESREHGTEMPFAARGAASPTVASPGMTRLMSVVALVALASAVVAVARGAYFAVTDAWVAPMKLSPDSREVVALRIQAFKDKDQHARLESEVTSAAAEIVAIDTSLLRLRALQENYSKAIHWSTSSRDDELAALLDQKQILERQRDLTKEPIERSETAVVRATRDLEAGVITATELETARDNLARTRLTRNEKELDYLRANAALDVASREADALQGAAARPSASRRAQHLASPDVMRLDEVRINTELQIARLGADRRAAEARETAARASIAGMDELQAELEAAPFMLAAGREIDLAFVPYAHLDGVQAGDAIYRCRWFLFGCHEAGRIKRLFPGEVVTNDPWGSVARGHYVELEMSDRAAMGERTLRVRRGAVERGAVVASRIGQ
jgi:hypothetical protein